MAPTLTTILKPDVQRIFDHFSTCFNTRIVFFNAAGEIESACRNRPDSRYCQLLRDHLWGAETCHTLDQEKCLEAAQKQRVLCYQCHAGLVEATKPLVHCGRLLGFVTIGQLRTQESMPATVREAWHARHCSTDELDTAYTVLPMVTEEELDALLDLFSILVDYIVSRQMIALAPNRNLEMILHYMEQHAAESFSLEDVARIIHKRPSTVSHLFAEHLGQSFKRTLLEIKLRHAEEYMRRYPERTVAEASLSAGFADPLYFSRLYKRYRDVPPSYFLTVCRGHCHLFSETGVIRE